MNNFQTNSSNDLSESSSSYSSVSVKLPCQIVFNAEYPIHLGVSYYLPLVIAIIMIGFITIVFNGAFLLVTIRNRRLQTLHNILLICLSITDFITGVVVTPISAMSYFFLMNEKYPCALYWISMILFDAVSITSFITLALISFEKYLAIMYSFCYERMMTKRKLLFMAVAVWIIGTIVTMISHLIGLSNPKLHRMLWLHVNYFGIIFYAAILYCYGRIFREIQQVKRRIAIENSFHSSQTTLRESSKAAITTAIVIGALTLCYLPSTIVYIQWPSNEKEHIKRGMEALMKLIAYVAVLLSSSLNPVIYYFRISLVRTEIKRIF